MTEKTKINNYPYYIWTLTIFTSPLLWIIYYGMFNDGGWWSMLQTIPAFFSLGLFLSLPWLLVFVLLFRLLEKKISSSILSKIILSAFGISGIFLILKLIGGTLMMELALFYNVTFLLYLWLLKINGSIT